MKKTVNFKDMIFEVVLNKGTWVSRPYLKISLKEGDKELYKEKRGKKELDYLLDIYQDDDKLKKKLIVWGDTMRFLEMLTEIPDNKKE